MDIEIFNAEVNGEGLRIGIVQARFNEPICNALREACLAELERLGVSEEDVLVCTVPGALEVPLALRQLAHTAEFDALIKPCADSIPTESIKLPLCRDTDDQKFIANRVKRVIELKDFVPNVTGDRSHMYRYPKVDGKVVSEVVTLPIFTRLLDHCKYFWNKWFFDTSK